MVQPRFDNPIVDPSGKVIDESITRWNNLSRLSKCVGDVLSKLEGRMPMMNNQMSNYNMQSMMNMSNPQGNFSMNENNEQNLIKEIRADLEKKSIEELIYINFNPEHYVVQFTQNNRNANEALINEVKQLSMCYENKKMEYENVRGNSENYKMQYEQKEKELRELTNQKQRIDGQLSVDKLILEMGKFIEENYQKPKSQLISDFMSKKITLDEFQEKFKELTKNYHYYSIIKDKLNLCK